MSHAPKWRALVAYDADALSDEGRRRVEAHLDHCEVCEQALAEIAALESVSQEIRYSDVDIDFSRMEMTLRREAKEVATGLRRRSHRRLAAGVAVLAAAAALLFFVKTRQDQSEGQIAHAPSTHEEAELPDEHQPAVGAHEEIAPETAGPAGKLVAVSGEVRIDDEPARIGGEVRAGASITTGSGSAHLNLGPGTSFAVLSESRLGVDELGDEVVLQLHGGSVASQVRTGTSYIVHAPPYRIRVQGTRFEVRRSGEDVSVTLDEGIVEVIRGDELVRHMEAPDAWTSRIDWPATEIGEVLRPHQLASDGSAGTVLSLMGAEDIVEWRVGDLELRGQEARLSLVPGEFEIQSRDRRGRVRTRTFELLPEGGSLASADLRPLRRAPRAHLDPADIAAVVNPARRALQRCYERELRRNDPTLGGAYTLRVGVRADGAVRTVRVTTSDELPPPMRNCLVRTASSWSFPAPGGPVSFDLPLNLSTR